MNKEEVVQIILQRVKRETSENMKLVKPKKDGEMIERVKEIIKMEVDENAD